jgi:hypothetical protein
MNKHQANELILEALSKSTQAELSSLSNEELINILFEYYKPKEKDKLSKVTSTIIKNELVDRLDRLTKADEQLKHEIKAAEGLFKLMEDLLGMSFDEAESESEIEQLATNVAYQFKNLVIYREFVKAILRHMTLDEELGVVSISILKDAQTDLEQADYNFIKEIVAQLQKANIDNKNANMFESDNKEVC